MEQYNKSYVQYQTDSDSNLTEHGTHIHHFFSIHLLRLRALVKRVNWGGYTDRGIHKEISEFNSTVCLNFNTMKIKQDQGKMCGKQNRVHRLASERSFTQKH